LRKALEGRRAGATVTKSELEEMFIEFLDEFGLPRARGQPGALRGRQRLRGRLPLA
jgi:hypothetical protein